MFKLFPKSTKKLVRYTRVKDTRRRRRNNCFAILRIEMMRILKSSSSSIIKNSRIVVTNKFKNVKTKKRRTNYCQESSLARGFFALVSFPTSHDHTGCPDKIPKLTTYISILKKNENKSIERCFIPFQHSLKAEKQKRERRFGWANIYFTTELEPPKILSRFAFTTVLAALQLPKIAVVVIIASPQRETRSSSLLLYTHEKQYR